MYRSTPQSSTQEKEQEEKERVRDLTELDIRDKGVRLRERVREKQRKWDERKLISHDVYGSVNVPFINCI